MSSSSEFDKTFSELELKRKTVKQLQRILKDRELPSRGNKAKLVKRVLASYSTLTVDASAPAAVPGDRLEQLRLELEILKVKQQLQETSRTEELKSLVDHISVSNLPHPEPPVFTGDPLRFPDWESAFETLIDSRPIPQREKIFYLRKYVTGKALEAIDGYLMTCTDNSYRRARETLSSRYGNSFAITEAFRNKLLTFPQIASKDAELLRKFADLLNQCAVAKETMPGLNVLDDCLELQRYARHLPEWALSRWSFKASELKTSRGEYPKFEDFAGFVSLEADRANDPVFSLNALKGPGRSAASHNVHSVNAQSVGGSENECTLTLAADTTPATPLDQTTQNNNQTVSSFRTNFRCVKCESNTHPLAECRRLLRLSYNDRRDFVRKLGICFGCFQTGHQVADCSNRLICNLCSGNHPTCFHKNSKPTLELNFSNVSDSNCLEVTDTSKPVSSVSSRSLTKCSDTVTSMIVPVVINCKDTQNKVTVYALLDTQSDTSFVDETIAQQLCGGYSTSLTISTVTSQSKTVKVQKYNNVKIQGLNTHKILIIPELFTRKHIPVNRSHIPTKETALQWDHLRPIASELSSLKDYPVGLLIGYNCSEALIPLSVISGKANEPFAVCTNLGWSIVGGKGTCSSKSAEITYTHRVSTKEKRITSQSVLQCLEEEFRDLEDLRPTSQNDLLFMQIMESNIKLVDGQYSMPLPFRKRPSLPDNRSCVLTRFKKLLSRFKRDPTYATKYRAFIDEFIQNGEAEEVTTSTLNCWYLPHHGVVHPAKPDKVRVVFDASAEFHAQSLNKHLLHGPDLTNNLTGVLCRFRQKKIAVMCDIKKMFHQFKVEACDRDFLRFLWLNKQNEIVDYRMTVHVFGAASSPGCANFGLKQLARDNCSIYPESASFIERNFYVDDGLVSMDEPEDVISLISQTVKLCDKAGLKLHKFVSNKNEVLNVLTPSDSTDRSDKSCCMALGVRWSPKLDCFSFEFKGTVPQTRKEALKLVASLYDPLGLIAPFTMKGKIILQDLCRDKLSWDTELPASKVAVWETWVKEFLLLPKFTVPRCYQSSHSSEYNRVELHTFCDASSKGYGACAYLRFVSSTESYSSLVLAKSRVAPLKPLTIPRLELQGALVAAKMSKFLQTELEYKDVHTYFWSDSKAILAYINNDSRRFHTFVCNRVAKIRELTSPSHWRYVPSPFNPADWVSRGHSASKLIDSLWLHGPEWSNLDFKTSVETCIDPTDTEVKTSIVQSCATATHTSLLSKLSRLSSWNSVITTVALLQRVVRKYLGKPELNRVLERNTAQSWIISQIQLSAFQDETNALRSNKNVPKTSKLYKLDPLLDEENVLRIGGRLHFSRYDYRVKHPCILPHDSLLTRLLILHFHRKTAHQGRNTTINALRAGGFHILRGTSIVSSLINKCVICRKIRGKMQTQKMSSLPNERCEEVPPFTHVGMDCFGPFLIKEGRKEWKKYGVVFSCLNSRAVHLEVLDDLSSDALISALRCLISLRGPISNLYCDRGTNFVGADNELRRSQDEMSIDKINYFLSKNQCQFLFNTPASSHMSGAWERMIRTIRQVLKGLLSEAPARLDTSGLRTLFYEVMAIINSRPLSYLSNSDGVSQLEPLTPNHLLTMKVQQPLPPPGKFESSELYSRRRWRRIQSLAERFWGRWRHEYLSTLQKRSKWNTIQKNLKIGDVVMSIDDNPIRSSWRLAKVVHVHPSRDGEVRKVSLQIGSRDIDRNGRRCSSPLIVDRPVHKCILLVLS